MSVACGARNLVDRDLGLGDVPRPDTATLVREALRNFHDAESLAASPLATSGTVEERANSVKELLLQAVSSAFGETPAEMILRATIERGYFEGSNSHEETSRGLHLARSTYFRRLSQAVERVAHYLDHLP